MINTLLSKWAQGISLLVKIILWIYVGTILGMGVVLSQCIANSCNGDNAFFGASAGIVNSTGISNAFFGYVTGYSNTTGNYNSFFGKSAGYSNTSGSYNSFFGREAGANNTIGGYNSFFGLSAGYSNTSGSWNSFFGRAAGSHNTTGGYNSFFGIFTGLSNGTGSDNSFFGGFAGFQNMDGNYNSFFGSYAGYSNVDGEYNSFMGNHAGFSNTSGSYNSFTGINSGYSNTSGNYNSYLGVSAGYSTTTGYNNAFLGRSAGAQNTTGYNNICIGTFSGGELKTGNHNICLGINAGPTSLNSAVNNRLYIDVETKDDPLIYAEFDNDFVKINGTFEVRGGVSNPSSVFLKEKFQPVSAEDILEKVSELQIEEWSYIQDLEARHIGPTAESFFKAFGLGADPQKINTIDADGVALAAIQALYNQVRKLKGENEDLKAMMEKMVSRDRANESLVKVLVERMEALDGQSNTISTRQLKKSKRRRNC